MAGADISKIVTADVSSPRTGQEGNNSSSWLPLAEEIRDKLKLLLDQLYSEVPPEVKRHHRIESYQGTNWELTAWACNHNRQAWRMHWAEGALGAIKGILSDVAEEEHRRNNPGPRPAPKLARVKTEEEKFEDEMEMKSTRPRKGWKWSAPK